MTAAPPPSAPAQAAKAHLRVNSVDLADFVVQGTPAIPAAQVQPIALAAGTHVIEVGLGRAQDQRGAGA